MMLIWTTVRLLWCCMMIVVAVFSSNYDPEDVGVWEGNLWIPPGGRLYGRNEMQRILQNRSLLILGDSLGRRMASTIHFLLKRQSGDISELDIDQDAHDSRTAVGHHDHSYRVPTSGLRFKWAPLVADVERASCDWLSRMHNGSASSKAKDLNATDVIVEVGIHDSGLKAAEGYTVADPTSRDMRVALYADRIRKALSCLSEANPDLRVFWRTAPFAADNNLTTIAVNETRLINVAARYECSHSSICTVVDTERLLMSKSIGEDRLAGDTAAHFNGLARLTMIQLLLRAMDLTSTSPLPPLD